MSRLPLEADAGKPGKTSFYTCGMHPEVRSLDPDGKCPICQMSLLPAENVPVVDPASGKVLLSLMTIPTNQSGRAT